MEIKKSLTIKPISNSLFARLRVETQVEHEQIENKIRIFSGAFSKQDYVHLLTAFRCFYFLYEKQLLSQVHILPGSFEINSRMKIPLLDADLKNFKKIQFLEIPRIPAANSLAQIVGAMYVVEGATLGGQVIYRQLQKTLSLSLDSTHFFRGYNELTGQMWSKFKVEAEKIIDLENFDEVIASAKYTFLCLADWLESTKESAKES